MKHKKIFFVALCVALSVLTLFGCSQNDVPISDSSIENNASENSMTQKNTSQKTEVDPFEIVDLWIGGENGKGEFYSTYAYVYVRVGDTLKSTNVHVDIPENDGSLSNGDIVHVYFSGAEGSTFLEREYGLKFTRREADIEIHGLRAYGDPSASQGEKCTINLNDYVSVQVLGTYNSTAAIQVSLDRDTLVMEHLKSLREDVAEADMFECSTIQAAAKHILENLRPFSIETVGTDNTFEYSHSNGDVFNFTWSVDEELLATLKRVMNADFVYEDFSYTVEGLLETKTFDPFENYELTFEGENGSGYATGVFSFTYNRGKKDVQMSMDIDIICDNNGSLSNGDVITLSVAYTDSENFLYQWGVSPTRTEIQVTVSGLK